MTTRIWPTIAGAIAHARHTAVAPLTWNPVDHLLSRFAYGPTSAARAWVTRYGPDAWFRSQVAYAAKYPGYAGNTAVAKAGPLLAMSPFDVATWLTNAGNSFAWTAMDQLSEVTLGLRAWSAAQLYETLVEFFGNHLHVANHDDSVLLTRHAYDRDVIRRNVMGSFTSMLLASARHPAMLNYLNLAESTKTAVNENYGRELLELHTVGLHYTENDVQNAARILTGRTVDSYAGYVYEPAIHATGRVQVLGFSSANATAAGGEKAADDLLRYLAAHPLTAQTLARKLCVRFVSDTPSAGLVDAVAKAYLDNRTQILPMVSTILRCTEFWESRGRKVRRPAENVLATVRVLGLRPTHMTGALSSLYWATAQMGDSPYDWPAPNGYPDVATAWRSCSTLLAEWTAHVALVGGWWNGLAPADVTALYTSAPSSGSAVSALTRQLTGSAWTSGQLATLQSFLGETPATLLVLSLLRWLDGPLACVILNGPHHALR